MELLLYGLKCFVIFDKFYSIYFETELLPKLHFKVFMVTRTYDEHFFQEYLQQTNIRFRYKLNIFGVAKFSKKFQEKKLKFGGNY